MAEWIVGMRARNAALDSALDFAKTVATSADLWDFYTMRAFFLLSLFMDLSLTPIPVSTMDLAASSGSEEELEERIEL